MAMRQRHKGSCRIWKAQIAGLALEVNDELRLDSRMRFTSSEIYTGPSKNSPWAMFSTRYCAYIPERMSGPHCSARHFLDLSNKVFSS